VHCSPSYASGLAFQGSNFCLAKSSLQTTQWEVSKKEMVRTLITRQTLGPIYMMMAGKRRRPDFWGQKKRLDMGLDQVILQGMRWSGPGKPPL
jgi:hypothetical protein